jgi:ribosomal protein S27AE
MPAKKPPPCPRCGETYDTHLHENLASSLYHSRCGRCGYRSEQTKSYSKAWRWSN